MRLRSDQMRWCACWPKSSALESRLPICSCTKSYPGTCGIGGPLHATPALSPNESGAKRRAKGLAKAGNARVRGGMVQLAWRFLTFQKDSALSQWYRARTTNGRAAIGDIQLK